MTKLIIAKLICVLMPEKYIIRPNREGDEERLVDLWKQVFKKDRSVEYWQWRFNACAFGKGVVMLGLDGENIVSAYSTNRMMLKLGDEIVPAVHGFDGYTHIDYRKHGIFTKLLGKLMEEYAVEGVKFMYGYPNTNSYPIHIKMDWKGHGLIDTWEKDLELTNWTPSPDFETIEIFDERVDKLWKDAKSTIKIGIVRNKDYLNWRYIDNPSAKYHKTILTKNGKIVGMLVLKTYHEENEITGHIIDALAINNEIFQQLVDYAIGYFSSRKVKKISCWFNEKHPFIETITNRDFKINQMARTCFAIKAINNIEGISEFVENKDNWYMMMGDCDIF